jgi:hypothetical protein
MSLTPTHLCYRHLCSITNILCKYTLIFAPKSLFVSNGFTFTWTMGLINLSYFLHKSELRGKNFLIYPTNIIGVNLTGSKNKFINILINIW